MTTINFPEKLGSDRADGKLLDSDKLAAAPGKKVVTDARDSTNALEIDLEDEVGSPSTVQIPKGSAVDGTARTAAAAAQADVDQHEASPHNTDAAARGAAVAAQADIDQHEANHPPGYTDAEADLRVQAAKGMAIPGNTPGSPAAGVRDAWAPDDHDHGITPGVGGGGVSQGAVDSSIATHAGDNDAHHPTLNGVGAIAIDNLGNVSFTPDQLAEQSSFSANDSPLITDGGDSDNPKRVTRSAFADGMVNEGLQTAAGLAAHAGNANAHHAPGTGGLSEADVDARVTAGVLDWAETGNTDEIPAAKLPATSATTQTITGTVRRGTPAVADPPAQDMTYTALHGLGAVPHGAILEAECTTAEHGYAVGDRMLVDNDKDRTTIYYDDTTIGFSTHASRGTPFFIARNAGHGSQGLTAANWTIRVIPFIYEDQSVTGLKGDQGDPGAADTAAQVLAKLLTVDGPGSGLDADLLDGMTPAEVAALAAGGTPADGSITTAKLADGAVTEPKLGPSAVTHDKIAANAIVDAHIRDSTISESKLLFDNAPEIGKLVGYNVTGLHWEDAPAGGGGGTDQTARDANTATQAELDTHEASTHNTDSTARSAAANAQSFADAAVTAAGAAQATANAAQTTATAAQVDIDDHEANHPGGGGGGLTPAQAARLLPTHTVAEDDRITTSTDVADQWELSTRRVGNPVLATRGNVLGVVRNALGVHVWDDVSPHLNLNDIFPRVAALPDHTSPTAPPFVYLDHSITEGTREDANMTIGEAAGFYGYSDLAPKFGSINKTSPLSQLFGQATANSITEVWSLNEAWVDQFTHVVLGGTEYALGVTFQSGPYFIRNITSAPTGITALTLNLNFKKADGAYFFQGPGHLTLFNEGWYELLAAGYSRIASTGYLHTSGQGGPIGKPTYEGQRFVNEFGQLWVAGGERARVTVAAGGTSSLLVHDEYSRDPTTVQQNFNATGNGGFAWDFEIESGDGGFYQFQGTAIGDIVYGLTWNQVWTYICTLPGGNTAANIRRRDHSSWLGGFRELSGALHELSQRVTQSVFDAGATDYYCGLTGILPQTERGVRQILTYTAATTIITNDLFWNGPFLTENDTQALIDIGAVDVNGALPVDQGNANRITVGAQTWGTKPVQDRRAAGLPAATIDTLDNLYEDTRGVWRGSSFIDEERDGVGTFTDVAFGTAPFIGIFGRLTGLQSLHPASGQAAGNWAIVEHAPDPGFYSVVSGHWVLAHTDAEVQALLDSLTGNSAGDSRYWGWHGNAVLAMHRRGAIDATKKYYFFNYSAQRVQLLTNSTYVAGTEAGTIEYDFTLVTPASFPAGGEVVLYETAAAGIALDSSAALIPGNIVCPETGHLEVYFEQISGLRKGSIAESTLPAARLRLRIGTVGMSHDNNNANALTMTFGANRGVSMACITTTFYLMLSAQDSGNYYIHITHRP